VKKTGSENMDMAVPETRRHHQSFTLNHGGVARDFEHGIRSNGNDAAVVHKD
jgi:hypothetical protein